jgi:multidrug efflux pump subunit AcrA (membrane-fusion protein)
LVALGRRSGRSACGVFHGAFFLRERLPVRVAAVEHAMLVNTVSTNGRVEPTVANYQFYSPIATTVKAVYAQEGDTVPAGKLLVTLDDVAAGPRWQAPRAR